MSLKSVVLVTIGFLTLGLGAVGIFLPIMPTTPFVLVAAACFGSSSPRLYRKLLATKYFGEFVDNYKNKNGITVAVKGKAIAFLWVTLAISAVVFSRLLVTVILLTVGVAVTVHILTIRSR